MKRFLPLVFLTACTGSAPSVQTAPDAVPNKDVFGDTVVADCSGPVCTQNGRCTLASGQCVADPSSCLESGTCKKYGYCTAVQHVGTSLVTCEVASATCKDIEGNSVVCGDDNQCTFDFCWEDGCRYGWSLTPTACGKCGTCSKGTCASSGACPPG